MSTFYLDSGSINNLIATGSFKGDGSGLTGVVASAAPGGANQTIQFNDAGATSGSGNFTFNKTINQVNLNGYMSGSFLARGLRLNEVEVTPTTDQNDYSPAGWNDGDPNTAVTLRVSSSFSIKITGLASGGIDDRVAIIENASENLVILEDSSSLSSVGNRFDFRNPVFLLPGGTVTLVYDAHYGVWRPIASSDGTRYGAFFNEFDDFIGGATAMTTTATEIGRFSGIATGTGASGQQGTYLVNTTEKPMGVYQIDTGTTTTGRAIVGSSLVGSIIPGKGQAMMLTRLANEQITNMAASASIWAGWIDVVGATRVTNAIYWQYASSSALTSSRWQGLVSSASVSSSLNTVLGPTVDTNYIWLGIFLNSTWTKATYFYSSDSLTWTIAGMISSSLPSNAASTGFGVAINKIAGATQVNCSIDLLAHRYDIQRG